VNLTLSETLDTNVLTYPKPFSTIPLTNANDELTLFCSYTPADEDDTYWGVFVTLILFVVLRTICGVSIAILLITFCVNLLA